MCHLKTIYKMLDTKCVVLVLSVFIQRPAELVTLIPKDIV